MYIPIFGLDLSYIQSPHSVGGDHGSRLCLFVLTHHEVSELPSYGESSWARILRNVSGFMDPTPGS